jgi:hypothetical protein
MFLAIPFLFLSGACPDEIDRQAKERKKRHLLFIEISLNYLTRTAAAGG